MAKIGDILNFIKNPKQAFEKEENTKVGDAIKYAAVWIIPSLVLGALLSVVTSSLMLRFIIKLLPQAMPEVTDKLNSIGGTFALKTSLLLLPLSYLEAFAGLFIAIVWFHLWVYIFKGRQGLAQTAKSVIYGGSPAYLFGWIPVIGFLASIWSWVLYAIGFMKLQKMDESKAAFAVLLGILIPMVLIIIFAILITVLLVTTLAGKVA